MSIMRGEKMIAGVPIIDGALNTVSTRPVQNAVITAAVNNLNDRINQLAPGGVYTKSEIDTLLADKADVATTYTKTEVDNLFATLYPIGAIYIGTQDTCPLATIIVGSVWELVSQDRSLQGSSNSHAANTTINAGLPNITGSFVRTAWFRSGSGASLTVSGAFGHADDRDCDCDGGDGGANSYGTVNFNASWSNNLYGAANTVQPAAYVVNVWRRTA